MPALQRNRLQPSGGRKEYLDERGQVTQIFEWFGYKLHLLVDVRHEVALAYAVTSPAAGDGETLPRVQATKQFQRATRDALRWMRQRAIEGLLGSRRREHRRGARRFHALVGVVMVAHLAFATQLAVTPRDGTLGKMRLSPIAQRLRHVMRN